VTTLLIALGTPIQVDATPPVLLFAVIWTPRTPAKTNARSIALGTPIQVGATPQVLLLARTSPTPVIAIRRYSTASLILTERRATTPSQHILYNKTKTNKQRQNGNDKIHPSIIGATTYERSTRELLREKVVEVVIFASTTKTI